MRPTASNRLKVTPRVSTFAALDGAFGGLKVVTTADDGGCRGSAGLELEEGSPTADAREPLDMVANGVYYLK